MNRFVAASIIGLLLLAMLATGVYFYQRYSIILLDPMRGVPADAALILEIKNPAESLQDFFDSPFRKSAGEDPWLADTEKNFRLFDSLLQESSDIFEIWEDQSIVISTHLVKAGRFDYLYLTNLPRGWTEQNLKRFIEKGWSMPDQITRREYENVNIYESRLNDTTIFTFASAKSVAVFSVSPLLVEQAVRQLKDGRSMSQTKSFLKVVPPADENPAVRIYFNNQSLKDLATSITPDENNHFFRLASNFARWNGYKAETEEGYLILNGSSVTFDTTSYLAYYRNQKPQALNASSIVPSRTALFYTYGLSSFAEYAVHLNANNGYSLQGTAREKVLDDIQKKFGTSFSSGFTSWIGNEMTLIITEPAGVSYDNSVFACVKARNTAEALNSLNELRDAAARQSEMLPMVEKYRNHEISTIPVRGILPLLYGKIFSSLSGCSYTSINDYIIFSNQHASLKSLIDENEDGETLGKEELFRNAASRMNGLSNALLYLNPQRSFNLYKPAELHSFLSTIYSSTGILAQWDYKGGSLNSRILFNFHKKSMKEPVLYWATQLDTVLDGDPVTLREKDGSVYVYVQDAKHNLYKLDESGLILWKKDIGEKIMSRLHVVDLYRDGRRQLLFNTPSRLMLIDGEGNPAGHYPIRLPALATNGCTVASTVTGFTIYVACSNNYLYAYEAGGKPLADWNYLRISQTINKPVQAFSHPSGTYLLINGDSGELMIADRKGNQKFSFGGQFTQSLNGICYLYENDSSGNVIWTTTDTSGNMIYFSMLGAVSKTETGNFSPLHQFRYTSSLTQSDVSWFYFDKNILYKLDDEGEIILTRPLPGFNSLVNEFNLPDGSTGLVISSFDHDRFTLINSKGEGEKGFPLKGSIHPVLVELHKNVIISGNKQGMLYCYKTE